MCAAWWVAQCPWKPPSWSPLSLQTPCLVSGAGGRLPTPAVAGPQRPAVPTFTHTLPSPSPPSWGLTLCSLSPALGVTPPVRIESSSSHVAEGQTLDLNCLVSGQAHAQVTWHKRGSSLPARHQVGGGVLRGA